MEQELRILHIENNPADSRIVEAELRKDGFRALIHRVETLNDFDRALRQGKYFLILSAYSIRNLNPLDVLRMAREQRPEIPFIFLSGVLGEEEAIECLKHGATDYVLKKRVVRLVPAVRRALEEAQEQARRKQAEAELRQSEARFRSFVEATNQVVWRTDALGQVDQPILSWNAFTGQTDEEAAGFGWIDAIHPEDRTKVVEAWRQASAARRIYEVEYRLKAADGSWRHILARGIPVLQTDGAVLEFIGTCMDITERKLAEDAARKSERRLRLFFDSDMFGAMIWTANGDIIQSNNKFLRMIGYSREDLEGRPLRWVDITPPEHRSADEHSLAELHAHGVSTPYEKDFIRKDGSRIPVIVGAATFEDDRDRGLAFILDNTERKRAEDSAAELRRKLDAGLLAGEVGIFQWNLVTGRFWGGPRFAELFGMRLDENSTVSMGDLIAHIHPDDRAVVAGHIQASIETGAPFEAECRTIVHQQTRWVVARGTVERDEAGRAIRFSGVVVDITERRTAENHLRAYEERLRKAMSAPTVGMLFFNLNGRILDANAAFQRMSGYTVDELRAFHWKTLTAPDHWEDTRRVAAEIAEKGETAPYEKQMVRKDGSRWWGMFAPVRVSGKGYDAECMEFIVDTTDRKQAEAALERRSLHLQILHQAATQLLVGQSPVDLLQQLHPEISRAFGADVFLLYEGNPGESNLRLKACAGVTEAQRTKLETLRYGRAIGVRTDEALRPIAASHVQWSDAPENRFIRELGFHSYLYYPLVLNERLHGTVAFASRTRDDYDPTDIDFFDTIASTLAEALERERLKSELQSHAASLEGIVQERTIRLQETIAELEQMSYSMIHDLRAPLRAIQSFSSLIQEDPKNHLTDESRQLLRLIGNSTTRMDHLVRDVLNYARVIRDDLPLSPVDVGTLARGIVKTYPELSRAEVEIAPDLPTVQANSAALTQCLSQLFNNAVRFAKAGTTPHIRLWAEENTVGWVRLLVEDNGIGISPQLQDRIFGMFQQLRNTGQGTGMGLAIVKKAVERMDGRVGVESEPGKGSRFWIELKRPVVPRPEKSLSLSE